MSELTVKPAVELLSMLKCRSISALELAQEHLREIKRLNPALRAFVDVQEENVKQSARKADSMRASSSYCEDALALLGLPLSIKSSICVANHLCETGSIVHRGYRPTEDALAVRLLRNRGAIILGTTNCPEFLMAYETDNLLYGATCNPWSLEHQAGGSSGGEASAIATGLSAGGLGSDSGGSVRIPAHFTGICSFKPTPGRISGSGHTLPCVGPFATLGTLGPMARTMQDISLLFKNVAPTGTTDRGALSPLSLPIGLLEDDGSVPVSAETWSSLRVAGEALEDRGFSVVPFHSTYLESARRLWQEFFVRCGRELLEPIVMERREELSPTFKYFLEYAGARPPISARELLAAWADADELRSIVNEELAGFSAVLTPVASIPAFRHGERTWTIDGESIEYFDAMQFTQWFNLLGAPAAVVPVGFSREGLPIGIQIAGRQSTDTTVLHIASILDEDFGYTPPPISLKRNYGSCF